MSTREEQSSAYNAGHQAGSPLTYEQWLSRYISASGPEAWPTTPPQPVKIRYKYLPPGSIRLANLFAGAALELDLTNPASAALLTTVRASVAWADTVAGAWSSFNNNIPRITDRGLLVEEARTNVVLWNRNLSNAAWVKTTMTAALNQTGIDGVINSASSLIATADNATALQTISLASAARWQSAWVMRITGSGVVQMTMDNGTTWTAVTVPAAWTRVAIPTQTLANPIVGFRIVTNGDAIAVDFVQNENGVFGTSPILVTTAAVARAAETILVTGFGWFNATEGTILVDGLANQGTTSATYVSINDTTNNERFLLANGASNTVWNPFVIDGGVAQASFNGGSSLAGGKVALAYKLNDFAAAAQGALLGTDSVGTLPTVTRMTFGGTTIAGVQALIRRVTYWPTRLPNAQIQSLTL